MIPTIIAFAWNSLVRDHSQSMTQPIACFGSKCPNEEVTKSIPYPSGIQRESLRSDLGWQKDPFYYSILKDE